MTPKTNSLILNTTATLLGFAILVMMVVETGIVPDLVHAYDSAVRTYLPTAMFAAIFAGVAAEIHNARHRAERRAVEARANEEAKR